MVLERDLGSVLDLGIAAERGAKPGGGHGGGQANDDSTDRRSGRQRCANAAEAVIWIVHTAAIFSRDADAS